MPINIDGSKGIRQNTTEVTKIPVGTTAQRPANPEAGMIRFNTDFGFVEGYDPVANDWRGISQGAASIVASGGTVTDIEQDGELFRVHTFTSSGTFDVARGGDVEYLVVAGGGSGGSACNNGAGGGGGAGGYRSSVTNEPSGGGTSSEQKITMTVNTHPVIVGTGGSNVSGNTVGNDGLDSQFADIISIGGGGGGIHSDNSARDGGSGGGSGGFLNDSGRVGGEGTTGQGFRGANGAYAGGGGASERGESGFEDGTRGNGGDGVESSIDGSSTFRAGGGGGGNQTTTPEPSSADGAGGFGGAGGGGDGSVGSVSDGFPGSPNTGGGGGGTRCGTSGAGGSGIVIVRYRIG